ncbi:hypothetical protein D1B33_09725 [Lysinibacillus yapensis]|uniref:Uncharacterized protein n=1 Tax=Ureibacillus yapensis TaxID=2304605 RepID=A0A396S732_9BACL|nr:hypothetical protein [Lysinibacillus yapensis]RHW36671.1 hypothetical protein D1B33_09725 [Lysinibacillus yapensis]
MKYSKEEQETNFIYEAATDQWTIYSSVPSHIKSFMKNPILNKENFKVLTEHEGKPTGIEFKVENAFVTKNFFKKKRTISEEHKQALRKGRLEKRA